MKVKFSPAEKREILNLLLLSILFLIFFLNLKSLIFKKGGPELPLLPQKTAKIDIESLKGPLKAPLMENLIKIQSVERAERRGKENPFK